MNAMTNSILRSLVCGAAALVITVVLGLSFVQSTALPPGAHGSTAPRLRSCPDGKGMPCSVSPSHCFGRLVG